MTKVNRGKQFETSIRESFERIPDTSVIRLIDPQNGFAGVRNICDFIVYHYPNQFFIECKSCYGNVLPFGNITDNQWSGLLKQSKINGVIAGYIIWFIDHDKTIFITAEDMLKLKQMGYKSLHINDLYDKWYIVIPGIKRRIMFDYDLSDFVKNGVKDEYNNNS